MRIDFGTPSRKQEEFLLANTRYVGYGGARGGGKSWAVRTKAKLLALKHAGIRLLIMRRTFPELRENHILPLMGELAGLAAYRDTDKSFSFPNGSRLKFGYCDTDADVHQYQGQEYDVIFIDEATHFSEFQYTALKACVRGANSFPKRIYLTCNPGGVGHAWVKRLFIDKDYLPGEVPDEYTFIRAQVYDNRVLLENDPEYLSTLQSLPDDLRRAWLDGDWNVFAGQYFSEWRDAVHVIKPFEIPEWWQRYVSLDYGLDMLAAYWIALDNEGLAYVYRELYQSDLIASEAAERIAELGGSEKIIQYLAPPDLWNRRNDTGKSVSEIFSGVGVPLSKVSNDRVNGWMDVHEWLRVFERRIPEGDGEREKVAGLRVFPCCRNLIRTLPLLQHDERNPNDTANTPHELTHAPDAIRYFCAGRPCSAGKPETRRILPPELREDEKEEGYQIW